LLFFFDNIREKFVGFEIKKMGFLGNDFVYLVVFLNDRFKFRFKINGKEFEGIFDIGVDKSIIFIYWWFKVWFIIELFYLL